MRKCHTIAKKMKTQHLQKYIIIALLLLSWNKNYSQAPPPNPVCFLQTQYRDFHSDIIGDDFRLYFSFPQGYDTSNRKHPVLYVTDGDWSFTNSINCFSNLKQDYITIEPLIVAIGYGKGKNQRNRDLDPANGAGNFLAFFARELIPYVEQHFRVSEERTLYGYSLGGLFCSYVLFQQPELFNTVLIGAPGDNAVDLIPRAEKYFQSHSELSSKVFIGVGSFELETVRYIQRFKEYVKVKKLPGLELETAISQGMGHGAAVSSVMQNAILFAYCKRFPAVKVNAGNFIHYNGMYVNAEDPGKKLKMVHKTNKLYLLSNGLGSYELTYELIPTSDSSFFMREAPDRVIIFSKNSNSREPYLKVIVRDNEPIIYTKRSF